MKINKSIILFVLTISSLSFALEGQEEQNEFVERQETYEQEYDDIDMVSQEFDEFELETTTNFKEPTRIQVWATAVGLSLLFKYIEMRDAVSDWSETASGWWRNFLVLCHLKNEEKKEKDTASNEQIQA